MKHTTKSGKVVTIRTRTAGQNFATVGQVTYHGRVIAITDPLPYGFTAAAEAAAEAMLAQL